MKAAIVYESLYGNTHAIADAIAQGLEGVAEPLVMSVEEAGQTQPTATGLLVVGGPGLRAWFDSLNEATGKAAAFDTRMEGNKLLTGHASKGIAKRLKQHGLELIAEPASFLVDDTNELLPGELDRAREWGKTLGTALSTAP